MNKLSGEQVQQLIDFVQCRPALYDKRDSSYKRVEYKEKCWKEIASNLCADEKDCKAAWRTLKDQFVKRLKELRVKRAKTGQALDEFAKKYKNFERLSFLKDSIEPRKHSSNYDEIQEADFTMSQTDSVEFALNEFATRHMPHSETLPFSKHNENMFSTNSSSGRKTYTLSQPIEKTAPVTDPISISPISVSNYSDYMCSASSSSSSGRKRRRRKRKTESINEMFTGFLERLEKKIETEEPDNVEVFFKSIGKTAMSFKLSPVETSSLMMGVTELLHKIVANRPQ